MVAQSVVGLLRMQMGVVQNNYMEGPGSATIKLCSLSQVPSIYHLSSPEPKAQGELIVYRSSCRLSVCLSVDIFKLEYLSNQWDNRNDILTEPSLGWGKGCIMFWARSDQNSGVHGNG